MFMAGGSWGVPDPAREAASARGASFGALVLLGWHPVVHGVSLAPSWLVHVVRVAAVVVVVAVIVLLPHAEACVPDCASEPALPFFHGARRGVPVCGGQVRRLMDDACDSGFAVSSLYGVR